MAVALVVAGVIAGLSLPSSIYPPLEFPRIVIIAHSGTLPPQSMMLTVTRPIEQAVMEVPGIRRVRSRSIRGAAEISAQFDPATDMVVALQQVQNRVAEIRGELPADTELHGRAADAGGLSGLHPQPDRPPADRRPERLRALRHAAGARARARRRARSKCSRATRARSRWCSIRRS